MQNPTVKLKNGNLMPLIGLGTFKLRANINETLVYETLDNALKAGYRLIDTASCYRNEKDIGNSLEKLYLKHNITRKDLFLTSKVAPKDMTYNNARKSCIQSIEDLKCEYLDLCLIHWPGKSKLSPDDPQHSNFRKEVWRAFEELIKEGLIRSIGLSNYTAKHLNELFEYADINPQVLQIEFHPHLVQDDILSLCQQKGIFLQAYSSLGTGELLSNDTVNSIAKRYNKSEAQILLRWAIQYGVGVIPKSTKANHIENNFDISNFELDQVDMQVLTDLNINKHYCWDPNTIT